MRTLSMPTDLHWAVISKNRPLNVARMRQFLPDATWYVAAGEEAIYRAAGAERVVEAGSLIDARNRALVDARGKYCVQVSDDLIDIREAVDKKQTMKISLQLAASMIYDVMQRTGSHFGGAAPTDNPYFFNPEKPISSDAFIVGDLIVIDPDSRLKFDAVLRLKEDYDYTLQHLQKYGRVARCNYILPTFKHRDNQGGAVDYRTETLEQQAIAYLKQKWPGNIADNPRRKNEVLLRWKT